MVSSTVTGMPTHKRTHADIMSQNKMEEYEERKEGGVMKVMRKSNEKYRHRRTNDKSEENDKIKVKGATARVEREESLT